MPHGGFGATRAATGIAGLTRHAVCMCDSACGILRARRRTASAVARQRTSQIRLSAACANLNADFRSWLSAATYICSQPRRSGSAPHFPHIPSSVDDDHDDDDGDDDDDDDDVLGGWGRAARVDALKVIRVVTITAKAP